MQNPVHLYNVLALRASNHHLLTSESENTLGFGQIEAPVTVIQTFVNCLSIFKGNLASTEVKTFTNSPGPDDKKHTKKGETAKDRTPKDGTLKHAALEQKTVEGEMTEEENTVGTIVENWASGGEEVDNGATHV